MSSSSENANATWQRVIITGASKGLGNNFAICYAAAVQHPVHFVLHGRNEEQLIGLKNEIEKMRLNENRETSFDIVCYDLNKNDNQGLENLAKQLFLPKVGIMFSKTLFLCNAGTLGELKLIGKDFDINSTDIVGSMQTNVTSCLILTNLLMCYYDQNLLATTKLTLVNMSTLAALQPFPSWSLYCAMKASREMFFKTLAIEREQDGNIKVLNYAPGPVDTNMQKEIRECTTQDPTVRQSMVDLHLNNQLVDPLDTCKKLIRILTVNRFGSGEHIDYYDQLDGIDMNTVGITTCCACPFCTCGDNCQCKSKGAPSCDPCVIDISLKKAKLTRNDTVGSSSSSCCSKK